MMIELEVIRQNVGKIDRVKLDKGDREAPKRRVSIKSSKSVNFPYILSDNFQFNHHTFLYIIYTLLSLIYSINFIPPVLCRTQIY